MRGRVKIALRAHHFDATLPRVEDESSPRTLGDQIARQLKRFREAQRLPYTELSDRLAALGRPIPVLGLRRIERGERRVDVDELAALALALAVPPLLLVLPTEDERVEVVPQWVIRTWDAARWFAGDTRTMYASGVGQDPWTAELARTYWVSATPTPYLREHERFVTRYADAKGDQRKVDAIVAEWRAARAQMRQKGFAPPALLGELAAIEDMRGAGEEN